jgi:hypothetical protein
MPDRCIVVRKDYLEAQFRFTGGDFEAARAEAVEKANRNDAEYLILEIRGVVKPDNGREDTENATRAT